MKKFFLFSIVILSVATLSFAADFAPTIMTLSVPAAVQYDFDGTDLSIPFTVTGTSAAVWLVINTRGQAANIVGIQNGYLGWHYVNKIDTTVYVSSRYSREPGETTVVWDGNNQDGNAVAEGEYDYYLWAYDDKTPRQVACNFIMIGYDWESQFTHIYEIGEDGMNLSNPLIVNSPAWWNTGTTYGQFPHGTTMKWTLGGDPMDETLLQTTKCPIYVVEDIGASDFSYGGPVFDPNDYGIFYHCSVNITQQTSTMMKWQVVTSGEAIQDLTWLGWDELTWEQKGDAIGFWSQKPASFTDREYIYTISPGLHQKEQQWNRLRITSFDGENVVDKQMEDWFYPDDPNPHDYLNGSLEYLLET